MVCARCKWVVKKVLEEQRLTPRSVALGEVDLAENPGPEQLARLSEALSEHGFELLEDRQSRLVSQIKTAVLEYVRELDGERTENLSDYLGRQLRHDYSGLSNLFSSVEGATIEQFYIAQRIERAKELLVYNELSLNEIAWKLGYSSVAHLSTQFKKSTGFTPTQFKVLGPRKRKGLDEV
ncbi:MAG TPA: helix-turn-helix transcriptional regulator [Saprospiraceae bacterium]|nr:helix-turn-helix transcriptional regulator [Saprospiraceae bacterium]HNL39503.1 helix-turn-helix transcriptional regulator [Saprospiraceae bacterium]HNM24323.1 helix-turn-helix transcriptional regulator [Saprospiraceae bacterium]